MVSIPCSQIKNIIYFDQHLNNENKNKIKLKSQTKSILEEAEIKGYFLNLTAVNLNGRFNIKGNRGITSENDNINQLKYIQFVNLHEAKIQRLMCLEYCTNLIYLNLSNNCISDITPLKCCLKLVCLDISSNVIAVLPDVLFWGSLKSLRILYVHDNPISEPDSVTGLCGCHNLTLLTLSDTPLSLKRKYRHFLVNSLWSLKVLDNHIISDEEIIEDANFKKSYFRSQNPKLRIHSYHEYQIEDAPNILKILQRFLAEINIHVSHLSPVIIIQKWVRGFLYRKKTKKENKTNITKIDIMPPLLEEKRLPDNVAKDNVKYLKIDLKNLEASLTIESLDREAILVESMAHAYSGYTFRSVTKLDQDKCSKEHISRALNKNEEHFSLGPRVPSEIKGGTTFRLMGVNVKSTYADPVSDVNIEKNRSHYVIREADRMFHENKLSLILPEIKSKPVTKTNSNILFRKSQGCMSLFLLNKWDKTDQEVSDMDSYHDNVAKIEAMKYDKELRLQDISDGTRKKLTNIKRSHEEHKNHLLQSSKLENEIYRRKVDDLKRRQEEDSHQKSKIKKEISFSLNFRAKQSAASNAIDRFERMAIKQDQIKANVSNVAEIRENIELKSDCMKSYLENKICNIRTEKNLEKSALDMQLFQQMNNSMNEAKMRVEKLKTIHRLVSCSKLNIIQVDLEPLPTQ